MKKKIKMTCILKSGAIVEDTFKASTKERQSLNAIRQNLKQSLGMSTPTLQNFTFGFTTISVSEIAAIKFYI
jgi:hypothetical protein